VIDALGGLGRNAEQLANDAGGDPALQARLGEAAGLIEDLTRRLAVAIGQADTSALADVRSPLLSLDERRRALEGQAGALADDLAELGERIASLRRMLAGVEGFPRRIEDATATAAGAADDVVATAARATVALERVEMTLRELQAGEHYVTKIIAELERATAARELAERHAREAEEMAQAMSTERELARQALADIERLRSELRARAGRLAEDGGDPRRDPDIQVRQVVAELRPLIEQAVRAPATADQIERLRAVMLALAEADLPSRIAELRQEAYVLLREAGVLDGMPSPVPAHS